MIIVLNTLCYILLNSYLFELMECEKIVKMVLITEKCTYQMFSRSDQLCLSERLGQKIVFKVYY